MSTWIKLHDNLRSHPKALAVGERCMWLYVCGLLYANEQATDGFIPELSLPAVAPGVKKPEKLAGFLVEFGLWDAIPGGWQINDYLEYQRSSEEIRASRSVSAERQARYRERLRAKRDAVTPRNADVSVTPLEKKRVEKNVCANAQTARELFAYWQERCNHPSSKASASRLRKIEQRLEDGYTVEDIRRAIDGASRAAYVNENGVRYDGIDLICRSAEKLELFMSRASASPTKNKSGESRDLESERIHREHGVEVWRRWRITGSIDETTEAG